MGGKSKFSKVEKYNFDKNAKIWNSIINSDTLAHEKIEACNARKG